MGEVVCRNRKKKKKKRGGEVGEGFENYILLCSFSVSGEICYFCFYSVESGVKEYWNLKIVYAGITIGRRGRK